jgi:thioredoxin:protein disulfide reductase
LFNMLRLFFLLLALSGLLSPLQAAEFLNPKVAFQPQATRLDARTIEVRYSIAKGYYLYKDRFKFAAPGVVFAPPQMPEGKLKKDENFGDVEVYYKEAVIRLSPDAESGAAFEKLQVLDLTSMGCADGGICYPPQTQPVEIKAASGPAPGAAANAAADPAGGNEQDRIAALFKDASLFWILISFFGFGLLLSLTPCVLPMLPILSGIIVGHGHHVSRGRAFGLSLAYVLGMALTYAAIGIAAGFTGTLLSSAFQNAWVLSAFGLTFVILSFSMFGFYELQMPSFLQSKLSDEANHQKPGNYYGVATMGAISALIVGPCVAAPLAGALLYIGQTGDAVLGGAALFILALGMGVPLLAVGVSAGHFMPKAGAWMEAVKKSFGVLLLATAVWFVTPVIPAWAQMLAWASLLIVPAIYLHALDPLPVHANGWHRFWKGVGVLMLVYGAALLIGTLAGGRDPLQPLQGLAGNAQGPARGGATMASAGGHATPYIRVATVAELEARVKAAGKPVLLDFYADWCVSCKEMERFTMSDPAIRARLDHFLLLQVDVTHNTADDAALLKRFGLYGPPGIIFFDAAGRELSNPRVIGFQSVEVFGRELDRAIKKPATGTPT